VLEHTAVEESVKGVKYFMPQVPVALKEELVPALLKFITIVVDKLIEGTVPGFSRAVSRQPLS
jgi:hypothetical protein